MPTGANSPGIAFTSVCSPLLQADIDEETRNPPPSPVFSSGTGTAVAQNFQWQAEPVGNGTSTASGSLNLLFGQGTNKLAETGLNIASDGQISFATGQTFPGAEEPAARWICR
jgi:hypothetical protein